MGRWRGPSGRKAAQFPAHLAVARAYSAVARPPTTACGWAGGAHHAQIASIRSMLSAVRVLWTFHPLPGCWYPAVGIVLELQCARPRGRPAVRPVGHPGHQLPPRRAAYGRDAAVASRPGCGGRPLTPTRRYGTRSASPARTTTMSSGCCARSASTSCSPTASGWAPVSRRALGGGTGRGSGHVDVKYQRPGRGRRTG